MKRILNLSVITLLLVLTASPCFADWGVEPVSKERAKELGLEIRSKAAGPSQIEVELEINVETAV